MSQDTLGPYIKAWDLAHLIAPPAKEKVSQGVFWLESNGFVHMLLGGKCKYKLTSDTGVAKGREASYRGSRNTLHKDLQQGTWTRPAQGEEEKPFLTLKLKPLWMRLWMPSCSAS